MTKKCKHFAIHELVDYDTYHLFKKHFGETHFEEFLWRIVPDSTKEMVDWFRERYGKTTINSWRWGGDRNHSGLRTPSSPYYSSTSRHTLLDAVDMLFAEHTAEEVRQDIKSMSVEEQKAAPFTRIESQVSWSHADNKPTGQDEIYFFNP